MNLNLNISIETADKIENDELIAGRIYYPNEGNKIILSKGLSRAFINEVICHEIGHLIDWYMSQDNQTDSVEIRELNADFVGDLLIKFRELSEFDPQI